MSSAPDDPYALLRASYAAMAAVVRELDDDHATAPTACAGWRVHELVFHAVEDARRGLVAAHTPADRPAATGAVSYWGDWGVDPEGAVESRDATTILAGVYAWGGVRELYLGTSAATVHAVCGLAPGAVLATQGHAITAADLASTLAVEATLHQLDLLAHLPQTAPTAGPDPDSLREVRRVVTALVGDPLTGWDDVRVALVGTGRAQPTAAEAELVPRPVFA